jgi:hypothetical protein
MRQETLMNANKRPELHGFEVRRRKGYVEGKSPVECRAMPCQDMPETMIHIREPSQGDVRRGPEPSLVIMGRVCAATLALRYLMNKLLVVRRLDNIIREIDQKLSEAPLCSRVIA